MSDVELRTRRELRALAFLACVSAALLAGAAHAEDRDRPARKATLPRATLLATGGATKTAAPLNAVIHAALEELHVVAIVAAPGMDLAAIQLALDCVAQTPRCLKAVAAQDHTQVLISPSLQLLPDALVLSVLRFDTREGELRRVVRRCKGQTVGHELLDAVPNMLRELFELPQLAPAPEAELPPSAAASPVIAPPPARQSPGISAGPLILAGVGAASLVGAIGVGVAMKNTQTEYDRIRNDVNTTADAQAASDTRARGRTEAAVADLLFGIGGAALAAGAIWLVLDLGREHDDRTESPLASITPLVGPSQLGVVWTKHGGGL